MVVANFQVSFMTLAFAALGAFVIGTLLGAMYVKHRYHPNPSLIGALIAALLCFLLLEMLPTRT
jgi:predicted MFS family arabinose efflux permease